MKRWDPSDRVFLWRVKNTTVFGVVWLYGSSSWRLAGQLNEKHLKGFFFFCAGSTKTHNHYKCAHYFHCNWLDRSSNGYFLRACLKMKHYLVFICASSKNECVCAHFAEVKNKVLFEHLFNILNILPS